MDGANVSLWDVHQLTRKLLLEIPVKLSTTPTPTLMHKN